jgi:methenyltetrahydromethanopterin cyclohydrolase
MTQSNTPPAVSVNALAAPLVHKMIAEAAALRLKVDRMSNGTTVVDAGIAVRGGLEAGRQIAEICMGGLGRVNIRSASLFDNWTWQLDVWSSNPVTACLASQYAGWSLSHGEGKGAFYALGSGPARALGSREELFQELGYRDQFGEAFMVIEVDKVPPVEVADKIAEMCKVPADKLTLILTPTTSLAGGVQVVGRVLEVVMHKAHAVGFPLEKIVDGSATAPINPPCGDFLNAMGRTNDAIIFGGQAQLYVDCTDAEAEDLAQKLPSSGSRDFGKPFAQVFKDYKYDFYQIDAMLFSPARVLVTAMKSGKSFAAGQLHPELLDRSFGIS